MNQIHKLYLLIGLLIASGLLLCGLAYSAEPVRVQDLIKPVEAAPVAITPESHIIRPCDSQRTARRAHLFAAHNEHKRLDNKLQTDRVDLTLRTTKRTYTDENGYVVTEIVQEPTEYTDTALRVEERKWERVGNVSAGVAGALLTGATLLIAK